RLLASWALLDGRATSPGGHGTLDVAPGHWRREWQCVGHYPYGGCELQRHAASGVECELDERCRPAGRWSRHPCDPCVRPGGHEGGGAVRGAKRGEAEAP